MKGKMKVLFAALATAVCFTGAIACDEPTPEPPAHEHTYAETLTHDDTHHWYAATCEHTDEVKDKAEHTLTEKVVTAATYKAAGKAKKTCACGYETAEYDIAKLAQLTPECTLPTGLTAYKGETLADITLPEGWAFVDALTTLVGNEGNNEFAVKYTAPNDTEGKYLTVDGTVTVAVSKARPAYTVPTGLTATYGDTLADITLPTAANGAWSWKVADTTAVGNAGTNEFVLVFTPTDTGTYATVEETVTVAVAKANYTGYTLPTGLTATYGDTLASVSLGEGWAFVDALTTTVGNAGNNSFAVTYTPENTNYNVVTGLSVSVAVAKATPAYTVPTGLTATYGDTLASVSLGEGWAFVDALTTTVGNAGTNDFAVTYTPSDTANYNTVENIEVTVEVAAKVLTAAAVDAISAQTYTGELITPELTVADGATALTKNADYTVVFDDNENAGAASAVVTFIGNYTGVAELTFTINPAALTAEMITVTAGTQTTNGVTELATAVVFNGSTVTDDFTVAYSNTLYAGAGKATVTAKASTNFTGTVEKDYTIGQYAGATAKVMNAELTALDNYAGEVKSVIATGENDNRGLWYKAEMKTEGMYIVGKAVADNYIYTLLFANDNSPQTRRSYFEVKVGVSTTGNVYTSAKSVGDKIEIKTAGNIFDFAIWRTVENDGVTEGGKYTHIFEAFVPASKIAGKPSIAMAYSSAYNPADVLDTDNTTVLIPKGHVEQLTTNNASVTDGYIYAETLRPSAAADKLNAAIVGANGIVADAIRLGTITNAANTEANWDTNATFGWVSTNKNFVQVIEYKWQDVKLLNADGVETTDAVDYVKTIAGLYSPQSTSANIFLGYKNFKFKDSSNKQGTQLVFAAEFQNAGVKADKKVITDHNGTVGTGTSITSNTAIGAKAIALLKDGKFRVVVVRNNEWIYLYAPLSTDGSYVELSKNPIASTDAFEGCLYRKRKVNVAQTTNAFVVYNTTDYQSVLSTYYN